MKKIIIALLASVILLLLCACSGTVEEIDTQTAADSKTETAQNAESKTETETDSEGIESAEVINVPKEFTAEIVLEDDGISFKLPDDHDGGYFTDLGATCAVQVDEYDANVVAYHEYDDQAPVEKKTVGDYTFDYQKFDYLGISNWKFYVIRIAFTESRNQMEHRYYRIIYNVYAEKYDDAQVEKFMKTIKFFD